MVYTVTTSSRQRLLLKVGGCTSLSWVLICTFPLGSEGFSEPCMEAQLRAEGRPIQKPRRGGRSRPKERTTWWTSISHRKESCSVISHLIRFWRLPGGSEISRLAGGELRSLRQKSAFCPDLLKIILLYSAHDAEHNAALVLRKYLLTLTNGDGGGAHRENERGCG